MSTTAFIVFACVAAGSLLFSLVCILIGAVQRKAQTRTVEFYPPEDCSPLDVLVLYKGKRADPRAVFNPLCLYWADKGLITIQEDCKRGLVLHKKKAFPPFNGNLHYRNAHETYQVEKQFFDYLFAGGDTFYTLTAEKQFNEKYDELCNKVKKEARKNQDPKGKTLFVLSQFVSALVMVAFEIFLSATTHSPLVMIALFSFIGVFMLRYADLPGYIRVPFFAVWGGVPTVIMLVLVSSYGIAAGVMQIIVLTQFILTVFVLSRLVDIRKQENLKAFALVDSFREFLLAAEQDRVETLVEDNPRYYYDILPYCYILGVTEKMKVKFDRIMMQGPAWYLGDIRNTLMF